MFEFFLQKTKDSKPAQVSDSLKENTGEAPISTETTLDISTTQSVPVILMPSQSSQLKVCIMKLLDL